MNVLIKNDAGDRVAQLTPEQFLFVHATVTEMIKILSGSLSTLKAEPVVRSILAGSPYPITEAQWRPIPKEHA